MVDKTKVENIFIATNGVGDGRNLFDKDSEYSQWVNKQRKEQ